MYIVVFFFSGLTKNFASYEDDVTVSNRVNRGFPKPTHFCPEF